MPVITCTKFQSNQIILVLFSGVWDKMPPSLLPREKPEIPQAIWLKKRMTAQPENHNGSVLLLWSLSRSLIRPQS